MTPAAGPEHTGLTTLAVCIAHITGASASDVPLDHDEQRAWLAERRLGLVTFGVPSGAIGIPLTPARHRRRLLAPLSSRRRASPRAP